MLAQEFNAVEHLGCVDQRCRTDDQIERELRGDKN